MAKKAARGGVNKSAAVREYLKANGDAKPKQAAEELSKQLGLKITPAFVSQVKTLDKKKSGNKSGRRGRRASAPMASANGSPNGAVSSVAAAIKAGRELLSAAGSSAEAIAVIKALAG
jgi:hypothetical protein